MCLVLVVKQDFVPFKWCGGLMVRTVQVHALPRALHCVLGQDTLLS